MLDTPRRLLYRWSTRRKNQNTLNALEAHLKTTDPLLLVHQMGRAGSMTTVKSIRRAGVALPVFHTHWLNPESVEKRLRWVSHLPESRRPLNVRVSRRISEELASEGLNGRHWTLVTVFREPVARNISVFFLSIEVFVKNFFERYARGELSNEYLTQVFLKEFPHDEPLTWFDRELKDVFGIDVYDANFPHDQGYQVIRISQADLLVIKLERLNDCYRAAFREFMGIELPGLDNTHITEQDPAYSMYKDFIKSAVLPAEYLDRMYESPFARHFYTSSDLDKFRRKWSGIRTIL